MLALLALFTLGSLAFFLGQFKPSALELIRRQQTEFALAQGRDALVAYAIQFRETQNQIADQGGIARPNPMYGFLPLPDLGTTANTNVGCASEGCDANLSGNALNRTVIGRLPWRLLGTGPLRDGHGECLWYVVSGSHQRVDRAEPMNWDTLSQIDIVTTNDSVRLKSLLTTPHDRPVAIVFSPGPIIGNQSRGPIGADDVTECGGNYVATNYLDPIAVASLLGADGNVAADRAYWGGARSTDTSVITMAINAGGRILRDTSSNLLRSCPADGNCEIVANDVGLPVLGGDIFAQVRGNAEFRGESGGVATDKGISRLMSGIVECVRDGVYAFGTPSGSGGGISVGRLGDDPTGICYGAEKEPPGFFPNFRDHLFLARCTGTCASVTVGSAAASCAGVLIFANQRGPGQVRTPTEQMNYANYLEGVNLTSFQTPAGSFVGDAVLKRSSEQAIGQDIIACIPTTPTKTDVGSPNLSASFAGVSSLSTYNAATRTLTLGVDGVALSSTNANAGALFGCSWQTDPHDRGSGFRSYFRFKIRDTGDGFTFAIVDADRNTSFASRCGAARQHLGYSGNNGATFPILPPKIAIEFDTSRNSGFDEAGNYYTSGRSDPDYTPPYDNDSHVAILYWGHETGTALVSYPDRDDNVHGTSPNTGFPTTDDPATRPAPRNATPVLPHPVPSPYPPSAIAPVDRMRNTTMINRDFHVRVEVTPVLQTSGDTSVRRRAWKTEVWMVPTAAKPISGLVWTQDLNDDGSPKASGTVTATVSGHDFSVGDVIGVREAPTGYNGDFTVTEVSTSTVKFKKYPNPGTATLTGEPIAMKRTLQVQRMKTLSQAMSILSPVVRYNVCTGDADCASGRSCVGADGTGTRYCYSGHQPVVADQQYIYDPDNGDGTYHDALRSIRLGFTIGVGSNDQVIDISEHSTTWLP